MSVYDDRSIINEDNLIIIEHGRDFPEIDEGLYEIPSLDKPIKILCPANHLNIMKGSEIIKALRMEDREELLEFHFLGNCHEGIEDYGINHGTFERDEFYKKVRDIKPSFIGVFSIWPETYCHTLTEAWSCGVPVIGSDIGVIEDRILKNYGGWVIERNNPKKAYKTIIDISKDKEGYLDCVNSVSKMELKSTKIMGDEYIKLYKSLLVDFKYSNFLK